MQSSTYQLARRLARDYMRVQVATIAAGVAMMVLVAGLSGAQAYLIQPAVDDLLIGNDRRMLILIPAAILVVFAVKGLASFGQSVLMTKAAMRVIRDIQNDMFAAVMAFDTQLMQKDATGTFIARFISDCYQLREALIKAFTGIARDALVLVAMVCVMLWMSWQLSVAIVVLLPIAFTIMSKLGRKVRSIAGRTQHAFANLSAELDESLKGHRDIRSFGQEAAMKARMSERFDAILKLVVKATRTRALNYPAMETITGLLTGAIIAAGGWLVIEGEMTAGEFMSFLGATGMAAQPIRSLANMNAMMQQGLASGERIFSVIDTRPEIDSPADPAPFPAPPVTITLEDVGFSYDGEHATLENLSLEVRPGERTAIVGPSGAGKSTVFNLIQRFQEPGSGRVAFNGVDARDLSLEELRRNIAIVSQSPFIFNGSILDNIRFGNPAADESEVIAAAKRAHLHDFIQTLEAGYDTMVGEHGARLSGGQKQRLAIARAIVRDAPIILLDEVTSDLDPQTEKLITRSIDEIAADKTVLVIAHRLATTRTSDRIHVMQDGRLVASGRHEDLLDSSTLYAELFQG